MFSYLNQCNQDHPTQAFTEACLSRQSFIGLISQVIQKCVKCTIDTNNKGVAQLIHCLPTRHEGLCLIPNIP